MSEKVLCEKSDLVAIANAVREATGSAENYNVSELSAATIGAISTGGSGGNIETCTVTCNVGLPSFDPVEVYYINGAGESQIADFLTVGTITTQKNSYLFINGWGGSCASSGEIARKFYNSGHAVFYVTGDATLTYYG